MQKMLKKLFSATILILFISKALLLWPTTYYANVLEIIAIFALIILAAILIYKQENNFSIGKISTTLVLLTLTIVSWVVAYPDFKTTKEAAEFNTVVDETITKAVEEQNKTGRILKFDERLTSDPQALEKLNNAADLIRTQPEASAETIINQINPKINLIENSWSCQNSACGFATPEYVWTVDLWQYYLGTLLSFTGIIVISLDWKLLWLPSLPKRKVKST